MRKLSALLSSGVCLAFAFSGAIAQEALQSYIVVMNAGNADVPAVAQDLARTYGGRVGFIYRNALRGFSFQAPARAATALASDPRVAYVQEDAPRSIFAQAVPTGIKRIFADQNASLDIDGTDDFRVDVDVAVIDTGIDFEHSDLNVVGGIDCSGGSPMGGSCGPGGDDDHFHGTHVGGTIGALDNGEGVVGVAPGARLWAVKVLDHRGSGFSSWIVAGIDWVAANADTIEVANMSLGGSGFSQAEYDAIQGAVNAGVAFAVSAGNSNADASGYTPAAFDNVLTVSALADFDGVPGGLAVPGCRSDQDDTLADFSNWGSAVDVAAPGVCILSTFPIEDGGLGTISGTSMASPHVAGALALLASVNNPDNAADVAALYSQIKGAGNFDWIDDSGDGILEPLLDVSTFSASLVANGGGGGSVTDDPPSVSIGSPADNATFGTGETISFSGTAMDTEDGDITAGLAWTSDIDGAIGSGGSFTTVLTDETHVITASITDSAGNTTDASVTIVVGDTVPPPAGDFQLSATPRKVRGTRYVDLSWSGATSVDVDIYRDGAPIATTSNDGAYTDDSLGKGGGSATYSVCEAGTATCSNDAFVVW